MAAISPLQPADQVWASLPMRRCHTSALGPLSTVVGKQFPAKLAFFLESLCYQKSICLRCNSGFHISQSVFLSLPLGPNRKLMTGNYVLAVDEVGKRQLLRLRGSECLSGCFLQIKFCTKADRSSCSYPRVMFLPVVIFTLRGPSLRLLHDSEWKSKAPSDRSLYLRIFLSSQSLEALIHFFIPTSKPSDSLVFRL